MTRTIGGLMGMVSERLVLLISMVSALSGFAWVDVMHSSRSCLRSEGLARVDCAGMA